jgi:hypothetical protein
MALLHGATKPPTLKLPPSKLPAPLVTGDVPVGLKTGQIRITITSGTDYYSLASIPPEAKYSTNYRFFLDASGTQSAVGVKIDGNPELRGVGQIHSIILYIEDKWTPTFLQATGFTKTTAPKLYLETTFGFAKSDPVDITKPQVIQIKPAAWEVQEYPYALTALHPGVFKPGYSYGGNLSTVGEDILDKKPVSDILTDASGLKLSGDLKINHQFNDIPVGQEDFTDEFLFEGKSAVALNAFNKNDNYFNSVSLDSQFLLGPYKADTFVKSDSGVRDTNSGFRTSALYGFDCDVQSDKSFQHVDLLEGVMYQAYVYAPWLQRAYDWMPFGGMYAPPNPSLFARFTASHIDSLSGNPDRGEWALSAELDWTKPLYYYSWEKSAGPAEEAPDFKNSPKSASVLGFDWNVKSMEVDFVSSGVFEYDIDPGKVHDTVALGIQCTFVNNESPLTKIPLIGSFFGGNPVISVKYEDGSLAPTFQHYGGFLAGIGLTF